jgi:hypothetical protein
MFGRKPRFYAVLNWVAKELRPRVAALSVLPLSAVQWLLKMLSESIPEGKFWLEPRFDVGGKILFTASDGMTPSSRLVGTVLELIGRLFAAPSVNPQRHDAMVLLVYNFEKSYQFDHLNWRTPQVYPVMRRVALEVPRKRATRRGTLFGRLAALAKEEHEWMNSRLFGQKLLGQRQTPSLVELLLNYLRKELQKTPYPATTEFSETASGEDRTTATSSGLPATFGESGWVKSFLELLPEELERELQPKPTRILPLYCHSAPKPKARSKTPRSVGGRPENTQ